jgi:acetylornithine deacetylase/succinyl-diaminopimelate desuccinylase-like protein
MTSPQVHTKVRVSELAADRGVHRAFRWFHLQEMQIMHWQRSLTEIPAPPFAETARATWLRDRFIELGLSNVQIDSESNVLGMYAADSEPTAQCLVIDAHVDTIFPAGTPLNVREGDGRFHAPGISDNGCGLAALLAIVAAMRAAEIRTPCDLLFTASVGEEGEGNLRGVRALFRDLQQRRIRAAIMLDGAGTSHAVTQALGSRRYRLTVRGPGGHSWTNATQPSAIVTLARALSTLADVEMPASPRTTLNIGTIQGGSSINAIAEEATAGVDTRSTDGEQLLRLEVLLHRAIEDAVLLTNVRARATGADGRVTYSVEMIGDRPAAVLDPDALLFKHLLAVDRHLNIRTEKKVASTNANIPLSLGIDAVTLGAGGTAGGVHTRGEWFAPQGRDLALRRILLLILAAAGP